MQTNTNRLVMAYAQMVQERVNEGFEPYMLTFMFNQLHGGDDNTKAQMLKEIEVLYALLLPRVIHHPKRLPLHLLPLWIVAFDRPVPKNDKKALAEVLTNDGLHLHAPVLIPPKNKLPERFDLFLIRNQERYAGPDRPLARVQVLPVTETPEKVTTYCLKGLNRDTSSLDNLLILPRSHSEMPADLAKS